MQPVISVQNLSKTYGNGHVALRNVSLDIKKGEILALLGPNGAGKTTLISVICGLVNASSGRVLVGGFDNVKEYRKARSLVGLVPQELPLGVFDVLWNTVNFSRGLFGKKTDHDFITQLLKNLSLYGKKDNKIIELSGGMKRRVLIAKALAHEPKILFLDEPTAGVDVELRRDMWKLVEKLRGQGVTIILTTHYIEEAEAIADRVGVINNGSLVLVDSKRNLMDTLGKQQLTLKLREPLQSLPESLEPFSLELSEDGRALSYSYNTKSSDDAVSSLLAAIHREGIAYLDIRTRQSTLEDIFVDLVQTK